MRDGGRVKVPASRLVAVIRSKANLRRAEHLRVLPDLFELRLDAFPALTARMAAAVEKLPRAVIITARHPAEGGKGNLSAAERRRLLWQFLPWAVGVDVELRSARHLHSLLAQVREQKQTLILSVHHLRRTPSPHEMAEHLTRARDLRADIFKIATRTDTTGDVDRLLAFFDKHREQIPISAMGFGRYGRQSRIELLRRGSALNYVHLGRAALPGQLSLAEARRLARAR
ncbi:MAG: type I 3-dehydroquinate dehydratase [Chthoniobacterales bacterium]